jgi:hypothetical protein
MKYVALNIDTECGGDGWVQSYSEEELKENVSGFSCSEKMDNGIKFYNDGEDDFSTFIVLNDKGLNELREVLDGANPFYPNKLDYKSWLSSVEENDDDSDDE